MRLIGILGGTFDPIHFGHLRLAQELADTLALDEVKFIPSANPPHKTEPTVSAAQRAEMVKIAIADNPVFTLDECELNRKGASYTIDTLIELRKTLGDKTALCLMMGSDAFTKLNTWHRWQELLDYCHIILVQRPSNSTPQEKLAAELETLLHDHYIESNEDLSIESSGYITMQSITALDISSTKLRSILKHGQSPRYLVPNCVIEYINQHQLHQ